MNYQRPRSLKDIPKTGTALLLKEYPMFNSQFNGTGMLNVFGYKFLFCRTKSDNKLAIVATILERTNARCYLLIDGIRARQTFASFDECYNQDNVVITPLTELNWSNWPIEELDKYEEMLWIHDSKLYEKYLKNKEMNSK